MLKTAWKLFKIAINVIKAVVSAKLNLIWVFNLIIYKLQGILIYVVIAKSKCVTNYIFSFCKYRALFTRNI